MGNTATNVSVGKPNISGAVHVAPYGTTVPTDATTELDESVFTCLGYVSEDGLENDNSNETEEIKAWGGITVYRPMNGSTDNFKLALIESKNVDVLKTVYGDSRVTVDSSGNIFIDVVAEEPQEMVWVFTMALRGGNAKRIVIKDGAITEREPITYNDSDPVAYGITISAYPDASKSTHKEYIEGDEASA